MLDLDKRGYRVEDRFRSFFKGTKVDFDEVDFETSTTFYEVKSCSLFRPSYNSNHKRPHKLVPHKQIKAYQHGRFFIKTKNHKLLKERADEAGKKARYIFAAMYGEQCVWKIVEWKDIKVDSTVEVKMINVAIIFGDDRLWDS